MIADYNFLAHEGKSKTDGAKIGSGRYPLGSGENPYQHGNKGLRKKIFFKRKKENAEARQEPKKKKFNPKNISEMSNEEIDEYINRFEKEKQLKSLYKSNSQLLKSKGESEVKAALRTVGLNVFKNVASTSLTGLSMYALVNFVENTTGDSKLAKAIATGKYISDIKKEK